ncbi:MAG: GAF domain-containing protein [Aphanocapsa sp. GSE-SYN-MK-11-07L]|jgi:two-component sensor histidine kinase|nr:GAF domain-containing protein [Aphanocapsa sp. GSE-SYN-MK-11-07L]
MGNSDDSDWQRLLERERLLRTISDRIRKSLELSEILNTTVKEVRDLLQVDRVMIYQFQPDLSGVVIAESVADGWSSLQGQAIQDSYFFGEQCFDPYSNGYVQNTTDIYTSGLSQCYIDLQAEWQVRANLVIPIFQGNSTRVWGLLAAQHCAAARGWQAEEIDLLQQIASQVSIALTQGELLRQTQQQAQKERLLNWVIRAVRQSLDLQTIFTTAASEIGSFLHASRVEIVQYLPEQQVWQHIAEYRQSSDLPIALGLEIVDANNPIAAQLKQGQVVQVASQDLSDPIHQNLAQTLPGKWLLMPLQVAENLWGSLSLCRLTATWTSWEVELAQTLAAQLAIAIQQAAALEQAKAELEHRQHVEQRLRSSLKEKEVLLQEVHHRVKNNLQVIYSLLSIQADMVTDLQVRAALEDSQNRVMAMAMVHQNLYQSNNFARINFSEYVRSLTLHLFGMFQIRTDQISLKIKSSQDLTVPLEQAVPCGLILNELITNAIKHGFRQGDRQGELIVSLTPSDHPAQIILSVVNNGAPLPANFDLATSQSMGLQLVQLLSEQLAGTLSVRGGETTCFSLSFEPGSEDSDLKRL